MPIDVTENYIRIRVEDPAKFQDDSFRIIWVSEKDKIKAVAGRLKGETSLTIQSFLFDKDNWTVAEAKKWIKDHDYTIRGVANGVQSSLDGTKRCFLNVPLVEQSRQLSSGDDKEWEMIIEAWASVPTIDRYDTTFAPTAFARSMPVFMATQPVMKYEHSDTIGRILDYKLSDEGLYVTGGIAPTEKGKEVATLIRYGAVSAMSFQFDVVEYEIDPATKKTRFIDVAIYEIGPVSIPGNPQATIEHVRNLGIELTTITVPSEAKGAKGESTMENPLTEQKVQSIVDSSVANATRGIEDKTAVRIGEVQAKVDSLVKVQTDIKEVMETRQSSAEIRQLIDKVQTDVKKAVDNLNDDIAAIKARRTPIVDGNFGYTLADIIAMEPSKIRSLFPNKVELIKELHEWNDALVLRDRDKEARSHNEGGTWHMQPRASRMKTLAEWQQIERLARALDTATSTEGSELIPTDFSGTIHEKLRLELKVAPLFESFPMPTESFSMPVETADTIAKLIGQTTTVATAWDSSEETPTSSKLTFTAVKLRSRIQLSGELNEGAAFPVVPWVQSHSARALARGVDQAIINGQKTADIDTGYSGIGSTDAKKAWDGLRYKYSQLVTSANGVDCGTFSEDNLRKIRQKMGVYGVYPSDLAWLCSSIGYLGRFMKDLDSVLTLDKLGPNAVILTGQVLAFDGVPVIVSEFVQDNLNAAGIYDNSTTDNTVVILVNRRAFALGTRRGVTAAVVRDEILDIYTSVAFWRGDFQPWWTPSTTVVPVNVGYNVDIG